MVVLAFVLVGCVVVGCIWGAGVLLSQVARDVKSIRQKRERHASSREELESGQEDRGL